MGTGPAPGRNSIGEVPTAQPALGDRNPIIDGLHGRQGEALNDENVPTTIPTGPPGDAQTAGRASQVFRSPGGKAHARASPFTSGEKATSALSLTSLSGLRAWGDLPSK